MLFLMGAFSTFDVANFTTANFFSSMFDTKNPPAFQCVTHFILGACGRAFGADVILTRMKPCYPCLERNQEKDFRQLTVEFFINVEKVRCLHQKEPDLRNDM